MATLPRDREPRNSKPPARCVCRMVLTIDDGKAETDYRVTPVRSDWHTRAYKLRKLDGSDVVYHVSQEADGSASCDCPAGSYRPENPCRHLRSLRAIGLLAPPPQAKTGPVRAGRRFGEGI